MKVRLWGTRGSLARAGAQTVGYGGDTSAVEVRGDDGSLLILDAGSGLQRLGNSLEACPARVDILLSHLHMDHVQGLGFFSPIFDPNVSVHVWGPVSSKLGLGERLLRYLSPPLFPVRLRELPSLVFHDVEPGDFQVDSFRVTADLVLHPGPTLGYRITEDDAVLAYLPDHEPALGSDRFPTNPEWISGYSLAKRADLLIHDAQYTNSEYASRVGWGHSTFENSLAFAEMAGVGRLVSFHHDPDHSDQFLDDLHAPAVGGGTSGVELLPGKQGAVFEL